MPGLERALEQVGNLGADDEDEAWRVVADSLAWLYRCEEAEQHDDDAYYGDRGADTRGQTLAGLIWYRGLVDHRGHEIRALGWVNAKLYYSPDGQSSVPVRLYYSRDGESVEAAAIRYGSWVWPSAGVADDRHGRSGWYRELVEGRSVLGPLEEAAQYLRAR